MTKTKILFRLIKFTANYKAQIVLLILLGFISVGFSVLQPLPIKYIIDNVLSNHPLPARLTDIFNDNGELINSTSGNLDEIENVLRVSFSFFITQIFNILCTFI